MFEKFIKGFCIFFMLFFIGHYCFDDDGKKVLLVGKVVSLNTKNEIDEGLYENGNIKTNNKNVGIMTCIDLETSEYFSLGHGLYNDNELIDVIEGNCYNPDEINIKKSSNVAIGKISSTVNSYDYLGSIERNTENGIYGRVNDINDFYDDDLIYEVAENYEVKTGDAKLLVDLNGEGVKQYDIKITNVDYINSNQNIYIDIIDQDLLETTGGMVKGMSGSPIIQNGKFVGIINYGTDDDRKKGCAVFAKSVVGNS